MSLAELTVPVLRLLGRPFVDGPVPEVLATIGEALAARSTSLRPLALLLDDADAIPDEVLAALRAFALPDDSDRAPLSIILAGRPGLLARLSGRHVAALRRGLTIDVRLHTPTPALPPAPVEPPAPPLRVRRARRTRDLVLASLVACLCAATGLYLEGPLSGAPLAHPASPPLVMAGARPSALAALVVPRVADAAAPPLTPAASDPTTDEARRLVLAFQEAMGTGNREALRSSLTEDVRYNGVQGIDAALDDQAGRARSGEAPRFQAPLFVEPAGDTIRVQTTFVVAYRDVAGIPGDVTGRAVWELAEREGRLRIIQVDYDVIPASLEARAGS
jgi:hypothetical protein